MTRLPAFRLALIALFAASVVPAALSAQAGTDNPHGEIRFECSDCHTPAGWKPLRDPLLFSHDEQTAFPLVDGHRGVACRECHRDLVLDPAEIDRDCVSCHETDFDRTVDPDHRDSGFPTNCQSCHDQRSWTPASTFEHAVTGFPLEGAHRSLDCTSCHGDGSPGLSTECFACHQAEFQGTGDPDHVAAGFDTACESCHSTNAWQPAAFDHDRTAFPLQGAHRAVDCASCHLDGYSGTPSECSACHQADFQGTGDPDHVAAGFDTACESCHSTSAWQPAAFDHDRTAFPLQGAHRGLDCVSCHRDGYSGTSTDCFACHRSDFESTVDPNHVGAGFPTDCESCHSTQAWSPAGFDHQTTGFPLTGAHANALCNACHGDGFAGTPSDCSACHQADFESTSAPNHVAAGFETSCESCHSTDAWEPATFDHSETSFDLLGTHRGLECAACHADGFESTPTDCFSCHRARYAETSNPDHRSVGFPTTCEDCHSNDAWTPAAFDHEQTAFPLVGVHRSADCASCHSQGVDPLPTDCVGCHRSDFQNAADPDHVAAGFPTGCEECHSVQAWEPATFDHTLTDFALTGGHRGVDCAECHRDGYSGTSTDCFVCHVEDYRGAKDPEHASSGFPTACEECHSVQAWSPAGFDHQTTGFPLTGAHLGPDCAACHTDGFAGTPSDCFACHQADYEGTTDPDHADAGLPTNCESCHTTATWAGADFDHSTTSFPLVGAHRGLDCAACHEDGTSGTPTECAGCHLEQYRQTTDPDHVDAGFPTACETCHTSQAWTPATFDHDQTLFPLRGAHRSADCVSCHASGYPGTPTDCAACHLSDYDATNDPDHVAAGFPTTCATCHDVFDWDDADWDHDALYFPIDSGAHRGEWSVCGDCHTAPGDFRIFECIFCHEHDRPDTDDDHDEVGGYVYESRACLNCHPDGDE